MKAREIEQKTMDESIPKILTLEEQTWLDSNKYEAAQNELINNKWLSHVPGSNAVEHVIIAAIQDVENMGYDVSNAEKLIDKGMKFYQKQDMPSLIDITTEIMFELNNAPKNLNHSYWKYNVYDSFEKYEKKINFKKYPFDMNSKEYEELTYKGWVAQICGGALGTACEGYKTHNIRKVFGEIYGYVRTPNTYNDDITYELAFLKAIEETQGNLSSKAIALKWVSLIPTGWSAEEIALNNLKLGILPPQSGYNNNPYREWIGAQMRGAVVGMIAPGDPYKAAKYAFMDGVVSHYNNGVLGEIFNAILVSLSYVLDDIKEIIKEAINYIPDDSEYYSVIKYSLDICEKNTTWEEAWNICERKFGIYNWIHAYPNAAAEIIALYFGNGDFNETMHIIAMEGYDVDCNAAQIATAVAIMNKKNIDKHWTEPIGDRLITYMRSIKELSIKELSHYTVEMANKLK